MVCGCCVVVVLGDEVNEEADDEDVDDEGEDKSGFESAFDCLLLADLAAAFELTML